MAAKKKKPAVADPVADPESGYGIAIAFTVAFVILCLSWVAYQAHNPVHAAPKYDSVVKVRTDTGHGSGVYIGDGKFLTATHVVDGAKEFHIRAMDGSERDAEVLWASPQYDVALLQIKTDRDKFKVTEIACRQPRMWEQIWALGNPKAIEFVQTRGVVIGLPRQQADWASVMIVDIPMYPGMSGGPVVDKDGKLIGLTVGGYISPPMNMAVPTEVVCNLLMRA